MRTTASSRWSVSVTGSEGGTAVETFDVSVDNAAPQLTNAATDSASIGGAGVGDTVTLTADFTDAGVLDTHTATIDWGDGTTTTATVDQVAGTVTGDHVYSSGGLYEVAVRAGRRRRRNGCRDDGCRGRRAPG